MIKNKFLVFLFRIIVDKLAYVSIILGIIFALVISMII
jgi:hypothetical protein